MGSRGASSLKELAAKPSQFTSSQASWPAAVRLGTVTIMQTAQLYLCTDSRRRQGDFAEFLAAAFRGGVDVIQLRDKSIEAAEELELLQVLRTVAEQQGKPWAVNDRADLAMLSGAPVFHIGQQDLPVPAMRSLLPTVSAGRSSHTSEQVRAAAEDSGLDYFCVGPVWATPTKPGRAAVGLELVHYAASLRTPKPWFAIGGINLGNIGQAVEAGTQRVVVVRAITEADDPEAAARRLKAELPALN